MSRRERQRRRNRNRGHPVRRVFLIAVLLSLVAIGAGIAGAAAWVMNTADSAPNIAQLKPRDVGQLSEVFGSDGSLLGYIYSDTLRTYVNSRRLPNRLKQATVAIEDRRFYQHGGIDYQGIVRAAVKDVFGGGKTIQGGSTLTMQLVRNIYLPYRLADTRSLKRKIIEAKLAQELEKKHSKNWILTQYLNDVDYGTLGGKTAVGVGAASQLFFDKPTGKLNLAQAALLAGLPQAPSEYNPFLYPDLARARRHEVLTAMVTSHYITLAQAAAADASPLQVHRNNTYQLKREPYVFDYVKDQLIQKFGLKTVEQGGLRVYTTIDLKRQQQARDAILRNEGQPGDPAAALVSIDPTNGHILAMATSSTYGSTAGTTSFDYATQSHRQTGSAFKVFALMTLIHDYDGDPNQTFYNSHELQPGWLPGYPTYHVQTSEHSYEGDISITKATTMSDNTVFAQLGQDLGMDKVTATAHAMGITSPLSDLPSEVLGAVAVSPLEMADAYATIASGGIHHAPTAITQVTFPDRSSVNLGDSPGNRVFTPGEAYAATQVMKTVIQSGTGTAADYGCPAAGKTGTTSNYTDAYFDGFTPQLATAVWVGYPNSTVSMNDVNGLGPGFGGTLSAPIWHDYMSVASNGFCGDFAQPAVPWHGTAFFGKFATTGNTNTNTSTGPGSTTTSTTSTTATGPTPGTRTTGGASPASNPTLYSTPPQGPTQQGNGNGGNGGGGNGGGGGGGGGTGHGNPQNGGNGH